MDELIKLNNSLNEIEITGRNYSNLLSEYENKITQNGNTKCSALEFILDLNLKNRDLKKAQFWICFIFSTYDFENNDERKISLKLINILDVYLKEYNLLDTGSIEFSFYVIFDTYFHQPGLITELKRHETKLLIDQIYKITKIKYSLEKSTSSDLLLSLQKIITFVMYFGETEGKLILENYFKTHFDEFIRECTNDELEIY